MCTATGGGDGGATGSGGSGGGGSNGEGSSWESSGDDGDDDELLNLQQVRLLCGGPSLVLCFTLLVLGGAQNCVTVLQKLSGNISEGRTTYSHSLWNCLLPLLPPAPCMNSQPWPGCECPAA